MIYLLIRHHIENFLRWKEIFDIHLAARQAGGATKEIHVMRNVDDLSEVTVILGWRSLEQARLFAQSVSLQLMLTNSGMIGSLEIRVLVAH